MVLFRHPCRRTARGTSIWRLLILLPLFFSTDVCAAGAIIRGSNTYALSVNYDTDVKAIAVARRACEQRTSACDGFEVIKYHDCVGVAQTASGTFYTYAASMLPNGSTWVGNSALNLCGKGCKLIDLVCDTNGKPAIYTDRETSGYTSTAKYFVSQIRVPAIVLDFVVLALIAFVAYFIGGTIKNRTDRFT